MIKKLTMFNLNGNHVHVCEFERKVIYLAIDNHNLVEQLTPNKNGLLVDYLSSDFWDCSFVAWLNSNRQKSRVETITGTTRARLHIIKPSMLSRIFGI